MLAVSEQQNKPAIALDYTCVRVRFVGGARAGWILVLVLGVHALARVMDGTGRWDGGEGEGSLSRQPRLGLRVGLKLGLGLRSALELYRLEIM